MKTSNVLITEFLETLKNTKWGYVITKNYTYQYTQEKYEYDDIPIFFKHSHHFHDLNKMN